MFFNGKAFNHEKGPFLMVQDTSLLLVSSSLLYISRPWFICLSSLEFFIADIISIILAVLTVRNNNQLYKAIKNANILGYYELIFDVDRLFLYYRSFISFYQKPFICKNSVHDLKLHANHLVFSTVAKIDNTMIFVIYS